MQCNTAPYIIGHGKHRPCKNRAETVQPWLTKQKSHEIFRSTASTVDIPNHWDPQAKQQPTGLIACGAVRRRLVRAPSIVQTKRKTSTQRVLVFLGAMEGTRIPGLLIRSARRAIPSIFGSYVLSHFLAIHRRFQASSFCTLCPILQRFAPFARFETVQKPCRNRALTPGQTKIHFIRQRLDGIGSCDRTPKIKSWRILL